MSPELKRGFWKAIKVLTFMVCFAGFVGNSFMIVKQFIEKHTITSQVLQHNTELYLPSFTICSLSGYKEKITKHQDLKLNNYLSKTLDLGEILLGVRVGWSDDSNRLRLDELIKNKTFWEVTTTYTTYKGRCHTIRYVQKVNEISIFS